MLVRRNAKVMRCQCGAMYGGRLSGATDWTEAVRMLRITADTSSGPSQLGWDSDGSSNASHENG